MDNREAIYSAFEEKLLAALIKLASEFGALGGTLLNSEDIDAKWDEFGRDYMIDAVHEFNAYPEVALAWAAYLAMGVTRHWDDNWKKHHGDTYASYYGVRGFDDLDEHVVRDILGYALDSKDALDIATILSSCAQATLSLIRHEGFESQSVEAYYVLIRCVKTMYRIGEAIELHRLGYKFEKL